MVRVSRQWLGRAVGILVGSTATNGWASGPVAAAYPVTRKVEAVDEYHGVRVEDPFRWLEDDVRTSPEVAAWVEAQNRVTEAHLAGLPGRAPIASRLTRLWDYPKAGVLRRAGTRYLQSRNDGLQNQSVLWVRDSLSGPARVLLDPNRWSEDGTVALAGSAASPDGKLLAYGVTRSGSDWQTWQVLDIATGEILPDRLEWVKYSRTEWMPDGGGFFYSRYPKPDEARRFQEASRNQELCFHRVGTPQERDVVVLRTPEHPEWGFSPRVTEDGRYLVVVVWRGTEKKHRVLVRDLREPLAMPVEVVPGFRHGYSLVGSRGTVLYFETDKDAPRGKVVALDLDAPPEKAWSDLVPEGAETLEEAGLVGNVLVLRYLEHARSSVRLHREDGTRLREVALPGLGTASGFAGRREDTETFFSFTNYTSPSGIHRLDLLTGETSLVEQSKVDFDPERYQVTQDFVASRDGTRVPVFLAHRRGLVRDGSAPTLLYGYGGFGVSLTPYFSVTWLAWMEMGGVLAVANLRGGGEYGEEWHQAGTKLRKQNVFDDFLAVADWLVASKVSRPDRLAIEGGSNGGLLVGAAMTQRPDLFGACLPAVGVMDMLRYHRFTAGRFWIDDYGSADHPEEFRALHSYSPYHNLRSGTRYPATLVTTADTDDRVVPGHSFKFAARLQEAQAGPAPVLIRIETKAGHGSGKPTAKRIAEAADKLAFLAAHLGGVDPAGGEWDGTARR